MRLTDFFEQVEKDERLQGVDVVLGQAPEKDCVIVQDAQAQQEVHIAVPTIREFDWQTLRKVATGSQDPQPLHHVTRIVGYFSRIENWNKSKLGELADRRRGHYRIASEQPEKQPRQVSMSA